MVLSLLNAKVEMKKKIGELLRSNGHEFGTTTGRSRRCGWFDAAIVKYTHLLNGYTALNLTKLDIFTGFEEIKIGVGYLLDGKPLNHMPSSLEVFGKVTVVYETVPGWKEDISKKSSLSF